MRQILYNDTLLATDNFGLPWPNRGLAFNDGFFETLIFADGRLRLAADHFLRMHQAATALHLTLPAGLATPAALENTLARLAHANHFPTARLRLQLWRAGGGRYTPTTDATEWLATAEAFVPDDAPIAQADFALETHSIRSPLSFCKGPQACCMCGRRTSASSAGWMKSSFATRPATWPRRARPLFFG